MSNWGAPAPLSTAQITYAAADAWAAAAVHAELASLRPDIFGAGADAGAGVDADACAGIERSLADLSDRRARRKVGLFVANSSEAYFFSHHPPSYHPTTRCIVRNSKVQPATWMKL